VGEGGQIVSSADKPKRPRRKKSAEGVASPEAGKAKRAPRARTRQPKASRVLVQAKGEQAFWVWCGPTISDLRELRDALDSSLSDEQFAHHVGPDRNDFARWVDEVLGDPECARALGQVATREEAVRVIEASLATYGKGPD